MENQFLSEMEHRKYLRMFVGIEKYLHPGERILSASHRKASVAVGVSVGFIGAVSAVESVPIFIGGLPAGAITAFLAGCLLLGWSCWLLFGSKKEYAFVTGERFVYVSTDLFGKETKVMQVCLPEILEAELMRSVAVKRNNPSGQIIIKTRKRTWLVETLEDASSVFHELNNAGHGRTDAPFLQQ